MMALRTVIAGASGAVLLAGLVGLLAPGTAAADVPVCGAKGMCQDVGENVPAQPYQNNPDKLDWLGSYKINGQQSWCIDFALAAPDQNESLATPTDPTLRTKFGDPVDATTAAEISFLLLRHGNTTSSDEAAALAYLLHSWTAPASPAHTIDPGNTFRTVAFDAKTHLAEMTPSAQAVVASMQADAAANHGPWTSATTAPSPLTIGTATNWSINVLGASGKGVGSVPVSITATNATLPNGTTTQVINTPADGSPLSIPVTPTGASPKLATTVDSPAATPKVLVPNAKDTQITVTSGGVTQIPTTTTATAQNAPGNLTVTKTDANTKAVIAGASIEVTGADRKAAALKADGTPLNGTDGKPIVLTTAADGTASVTGLQTPQNVCVIETTPPPGFDQSFDPKAPPTVCGTVNPGATLQLMLTDVPNKVPVKIPAGGSPPTVTTAALVVNRPAPGALVGFGALLVIGAAGGTLAARRASRRRR
ncbi:MAG TPA: hypothetical protein VGD84_08675 [Pseudonocardiaceae bacterium]